ncbi:hypothetical protein TIFTF001_033366 [Ficus carica]|uniref:Uncharacterized protein n=1 Tax=Ficus carica TaxID=3494 RepID=A0AA88J3M8_FICCA|nr:hypothetical protein TIFTF001_033366 [Ficus carica]
MNSGMGPEMLVFAKPKTWGFLSSAMADGMRSGKYLRPSNWRYRRSQTCGGTGPTRSQSTSSTRSTASRLISSPDFLVVGMAELGVGDGERRVKKCGEAKGPSRR